MTNQGIAAEESRDHFDSKYEHSKDPWGYRSSWYERRKYSITMASLTQQSYKRCWEPACSIGELTALLAPRCEQVDASDISERAIATANERLNNVDNVALDVASLPCEPPGETYDLVMLSEILYYLQRESFDKVLQTAHSSLVEQGELVVVHWHDHPKDAWISGEAANELIRNDRQWQTVATHMDEHFVLDVFRKST